MTNAMRVTCWPGSKQLASHASRKCTPQGGLPKEGRGIASVVSAPTPLLALPVLAASAGSAVGPQLDSLIKEVALGFHSSDPQALDRCRTAVGQLRRCCLLSTTAPRTWASSTCRAAALVPLFLA